MSEENKALVRRFYTEVVNGGNLALADELMDTGFVEHNRPPDQAVGLDSFKRFVAQLSVTFPDLTLSLEDLLADGNKVVARVNVSATHLGNFMGRIAPTGRRVSFGGVDIFEIAGGKIVGRWNYRDLLGLVQQLEAAPGG